MVQQAPSGAAGDPNMGYVGDSKNQGSQYRSLSSRALIIRTAKKGPPIFGNCHVSVQGIVAMALVGPSHRVRVLNT